MEAKLNLKKKAFSLLDKLFSKDFTEAETISLLVGNCGTLILNSDNYTPCIWVALLFVIMYLRSIS